MAMPSQLLSDKIGKSTLGIMTVKYGRLSTISKSAILFNAKLTLYFYFNNIIILLRVKYCCRPSHELGVEPGDK